MNVTLECRDAVLTIWFGPAVRFPDAAPIVDLPQCELLHEGAREILGFRFGPNAINLCPHEVKKLAARPLESHVAATLQSTYDASCDMGYIYLDKREPGAVKRSIDCGRVVLDVGDDGAIIGIEVFSPSETMPLLAFNDAK